MQMLEDVEWNLITLLHVLISPNSAKYHTNIHENMLNSSFHTELKIGMLS